MTLAINGRLDKINETLQKQKPANLNPRGLAREIARGLDLSAFIANEYR
jgi:hypothetical protein